MKGLVTKRDKRQREKNYLPREKVDDRQANAIPLPFICKMRYIPLLLPLRLGLSLQNAICDMHGALLLGNSIFFTMAFIAFCDQTLHMRHSVRGVRVCVGVCTYASIPTYMCMCVRAHVCMRERTRVRTQLRLCGGSHVCVCVCACVCERLHVRALVGACVFALTCAREAVHVVHVSVYACACACGCGRACV